MSKILVTGSTGGLGGQVVEFLLRRVPARNIVALGRDPAKLEPTGFHASTSTQLFAATSGESREQVARPVTCSARHGRNWFCLGESSPPSYASSHAAGPENTCVEVRSCRVCARLIPAKRHGVYAPVAADRGRDAFATPNIPSCTSWPDHAPMSSTNIALVHGCGSASKRWSPTLLRRQEMRFSECTPGSNAHCRSREA